MVFTIILIFASIPFKMKQKSAIPHSLICLCLCLTGFKGLEAQKPGEINIEKSISFESGHDFEKFVISGNGFIRDVLVDSSSNCIYLNIQNVKGSKLKKDGFAVAIDLGTGEVLWQTEGGKYYTEGEPKMDLSTNGNPFFTTKYGAWGLNTKKGEVTWSIDSDDFIVHPNADMTLANEYGKIMTLWNTDNGALIWRYEMNFGHTSNVHFTSDSCMVVLEKGIHHVYLPTGATWFRKIRRLESFNPGSQYGRAAIVGGSTFMFGLIGGLIAAASTSGMVSGVGSKTTNYLLESDAIYVAAEYLAKFSHGDSLIWTAGDLSKQRGVSSIISLNESKFLLVDYGYRYNSEGVKTRSGDASCEFISKITGELQRGIVMPTEGNDFLKDFVLEEQTISFLGKRTLFTIGLESLQTINSKEFGGTYANIGLSKFVDPNDYKMVEDRFVLLSSISDGSLLIRNTADKVVEFDGNLELVKVYSADEFYELKDAYMDFKLICNSRECLLIDENSVKSSKLNFSENALIMNGFLVDYDSDKATLVKLN